MRKALIGLLMAATAATPLASAAAQDRGGRGHRAEAQQERSERRAQRSERQAERRSAPARESRREFARPERNTNVERSYRPQAQPRVQSVADRRADREEARQQRRDSRTYQPTRRVESTQRSYDGARRSGSWDRDRRSSWDRNRSGSWSGRNYNWHRDGRTYSWNHDWRNDRRYNWRDYRYRNRSLFNLGRYYSPYGYGYSRFSIGFFLEPLFYSSRYWISNPYSYRLPHAYPGTRWVRYYDDVLLVDTYTGEVIDVIYDFFW